jgi:hypothetical protein
MKTVSSSSFNKWWISGLFVAILVIVTLPRADTLSAGPLAQDPQPEFVGAVQTSTNGAATIQSQEAHLDAAYFAENGDLDGLLISPAGLSLGTDRVEGAYTSGIILSPLAFTTDIVPLWGGDFPPDTEFRLQTRLSLDGGASWSDWLDNPEAFYPVRDDLHSGNLIWVGSDQAALQFRLILLSNVPGLSPRLNSLVLVFNDTSQGPTDGEIASQMAGISSSTETCPVAKPAVVSRSDWGCPDGQASPRRPPVYQSVTHIIIHQSETPNRVGPYQDWAGWVRSVWNYHANVLWWGDVGYNYLIDPNGVIYEGRAGGDDVVGIHDGRNRGSMAVGFLGCYGNCDDPRLSSAEPSQEMLDSAVQLMAWKLGQQGIDPLSTADYNGLPDIPVIAGGRDVAWTTSPGDNLYHKLPDLRTEVADRVTCLQPCQIHSVVFDRESYDVGDTINVTVRLTDHWGTPLAGAEVTADIVPQPITAQASTGFNLIDRAGEYDGVYSNTDTPGYYEFNFTATDPTGERFLQCSASEIVLVAGDTSPTPTDTPTTTPETPTPTPTPTDTPTPTPTVEPGGTVLQVEPEELVICDTPGTSEINVQAVENLSAAQLEVTYDPAVVQVIDADEAREGVQVRIGDAFADGFTAVNAVDTVQGRITFAATLFGGEQINGAANLISIDWQPQEVGSTAVNLEDVLLVDAQGQLIDFTPQNGTVEVSDDCAIISGVVNLQGRTNHSGVRVSNSVGIQTQTSADGSFSITGTDLLSFEFPGYLSARTDLRLAPDTAGADGKTTSVGPMTLLAGDVNGDEVINIFDLAYIATKYRSTDPLADLTADGQVDIVDLALAATNYKQQGPLAVWQ